MVGLIAAGALGVAVLMVVHGQLPWLVSSPQRWFMALGWMECGSLSFRALAAATCPLVGGPNGGGITNGVSFIVPGAVLMRVLGVGAATAYVVTALAFMSTALAGAYGLARRLGIDRWYALGAGVVYLASPTLWGMHGLGSTFWGLALIPAAVLAALVLSDVVVDGVRISRQSFTATWRAIGAVAGWALTILFMFLLDGYGLVMAQATVALFLAAQLLRTGRTARPWVAVSSFGLALVLAFLAYVRVIPNAGDWSTSSIDLFRSMGADLASIVVPSEAQWWASLVPWSIDASQMWGDGSNARYNYLGLTLLVLGAVGVSRWRRWPVAPTLLALAVISAVLALGPSLKVMEIRGPLEVPVTYQSYLMPPEDAVVTLPTTWLYENVPGLDTMRATYRWLALTRLAVVMLAAFGVQALLERSGVRRRITVGAAVLVGLVAISPNWIERLDTYRDRADTVAAIDAEVVEPMKAAVPPDTLLVIAPSSDGAANHYLANYLAPQLRVPMYNIGGDKALEAARTEWPEDVRRLVSGGGDFTEVALRVLEAGEADMVIVPFFDLRWSLTAWPTPDKFSAPGRAAAESAASVPGLSVEVYEHFATVTLAD